MLKKITVSVVCLCLAVSVAGCKTERETVDIIPDAIIKTVPYVPDAKPKATATMQEVKISVTEDKQSQIKEEKHTSKITPENVEPTPKTVTEHPKVSQEEPKAHDQKETVDVRPEEIKIEPITPQIVSANASDCGMIAEKVYEKINDHRKVKLRKLEGLTEYAKYRSGQLVSNFNHSTKDERAAATALKYGEYIDPKLYGINTEPYYTSHSREAIAMVMISATVDEVAERITNLIKNSESHWCYVGADEYIYIGVGITYESGIWYCDVAVATENTDLL